MRPKTEPAILSGLFVTLVNAVIAMLQGFGALDWSADQVALVMAVVNAVLALGLAWFVRRSVIPQANLADYEDHHAGG